jgi:hypothetical protein
MYAKRDANILAKIVREQVVSQGVKGASIDAILARSHVITANLNVIPRAKFANHVKAANLEVVKPAIVTFVCGANHVNPVCHVKHAIHAPVACGNAITLATKGRMAHEHKHKFQPKTSGDTND